MLALVDIDFYTGRAQATPVVRDDEVAEGALDGLRDYLRPAAQYLAEYAPGGVVYCVVPD